MPLITEHVGLHTNADPLDIPDGATQTQDNLECLTPGLLTCRPGIIKDANFSGGTLNDIISMFQYQRPEGDFILTVDSSGDLQSRKGTTVTTLATGLDTTAPYSWAKDRFGNVLLTNGTERGWWWNGDIAQSAENWGITAPAAAPTVAGSGAAKNLSAGEYTCAYRYKDAENQPIYSAISATATFTATAGQQCDWSALLTSPSEDRVSHTELWRSRADAPNVLYFIGTIADGGATTFTDDTLTDAQLLTNAVADDTQRLVIIGAGGLQIARRQGVPPSDKGVVVNFQDRMFFFSDPSAVQAADREAIYYSFQDEPESVHSSNVVTRQVNVRDTDDLIGGIAFGRLLYLFSERHCYTLDFQQQPKIDGNMRLFAARGLIAKGAIDTYESSIFGMDHIGPWRMSVSGQLDDKFAWPIQDQFRGATLDWANRQWFHVGVERSRQLVWFFVGYAADSSTRPKRAFVYNLRTGAWWTASFSKEIGGNCPIEVTGRLEMALGAEDDVVARIGGGNQDNFGSATDISYSWKSRVFAYEPDKAIGQRRIEVWTNNPGDGSLTAKLYEDRSATATKFGVTAKENNVNTTGGNDTATLSLADADGYHALRFSQKAGTKKAQVRWLELEFAGTQSSASAHEIRQLSIEGLA
jgi:hypothetical protein